MSGEDFVALYPQIANKVLLSLVDGDFDHHLVFFRVGKFQIVDRKIHIAAFPVMLPEFFLVFLELILLEDAAAGQPGKSPAITCLDDLSEFSLAECLVALEKNFVDLDFRRLDNLEGDASLASVLVDERHIINGGVLKALFLIIFTYGLGIFEEGFLIDRLSYL